MKKLLFVCAVLLFMSCSSKDIESTMMYQSICDVENADSLCKSGDTVGAISVLDEVIAREYSIEKPSVLTKCNWLIFHNYDYEQGWHNYDYLFTYLVQLDAIEKRCALSKDSTERIQVLKRLFTLFSEMDNFIEEHLEWAKHTNAEEYEVLKRPAFWDLRHAYSEYADEVSDIKPIETYSEGFAAHLYKRKWSIMNTLLIENDRLYGYDKTFALFDSILVEHATSLEPYTKVLVKAYMGLSGKAEYKYDCGITYDDFRAFTTNSCEWPATYVQNGENRFAKVAGKTQEHILNVHNDGFVISCDSNFIYNPTGVSLDNMDFKGFVSSDMTIVAMNENEMDTTTLQHGKYYAVISESRMVERPILCILLSRYGQTEILKKLLQSKSYMLGDTLVREGLQGDRYLVLKYLGDDMVEKKIFTEDGKAACDEEGLHYYKREMSNDSIVKEYYYGVDMELRRNGVAYIEENLKDSTTHKYNWKHQLIGIHTPKLWENYKENDTVRVVTQHFENSDKMIITTEYKNCKKDGIFKEVSRFESTIDPKSKKKTGSVMDIRLYRADGSFYNSNDTCAILRFFSDEQGRLVRTESYADMQTFLRATTRQYNDDYVLITDFNNKGEIVRQTTERIQ